MNEKSIISFSNFGFSKTCHFFKAFTHSTVVKTTFQISTKNSFNSSRASSMVSTHFYSAISIHLINKTVSVLLF